MRMRCDDRYGSLSLFYGGLESLLGPPKMYKGAGHVRALAVMARDGTWSPMDQPLSRSLRLH